MAKPCGQNILIGGLAGGLFEQRGKIGNIVKAGFQGDVDDLPVRLLQQQPGPADPDLVHRVLQRPAGFLLIDFLVKNNVKGIFMSP